MPEKQRHGVPGQINVYVLDADSSVTSYGRHNRLVVMGSTDGRAVFVREDVRGLPMSTEADRRRVAPHPGHRVHRRGGRLRHVSSTPYNGNLGACVEHEYAVA